MSGSKPYRILTAEGGSPAAVLSARGKAPVCLACELSSVFNPSAFGPFGPAGNDRYSHEVLDMGVEMKVRSLWRELLAGVLTASPDLQAASE